MLKGGKVLQNIDKRKLGNVGQGLYIKDQYCIKVLSLICLNSNILIKIIFALRQKEELLY